MPSSSRPLLRTPGSFVPAKYLPYQHLVGQTAPRAFPQGVRCPYWGRAQAEPSVTVINFVPEDTPADEAAAV